MKKMMILLVLGLTLGFSGVASAGSHNPCNPCAMKDKMMKHNPCEMKKHNPCSMNPCEMKKHKMMKKHNPCNMNPCEMKKHNPCSMNPCEMKKHKKW